MYSRKRLLDIIYAFSGMFLYVCKLNFEFAHIFI
jgi:hypothetical protein